MLRLEGDFDRLLVDQELNPRGVLLPVGLASDPGESLTNEMAIARIGE